MWRKMIGVVLCIALACTAAACSKKAQDVISPAEHDDEAGFRKTTLYYLSDEGFVVPVMKMIPWEEGIGRAAIEQLIATEENVEAASKRGLKPVLNDTASVTLRIGDDGTATLNIMGLGEYESAAEERAMVESVASTLQQFTRIDSVQLLFDGKQKKELKWGTKVGEPIGEIYLNGENASVATGSEGAQYNPITLFFPNQACSLNVPVTRYIQNIRTFEVAVKELIKGPEQVGLRNCYPENTSVLSCTIEDGVASVDFSPEFLEVMNTPGLYEAVYESLALTAMEYGTVSELRISVDGELLQAEEELSIPRFSNEFINS